MRRWRAVGTCVFAAWLAVMGAVHAQTRADAAAGRDLEGRRLDEALAELQRLGLRLIFSTEVVRPSMRVTDEPRLLSLRERRALRPLLDALLEPHGLIARNGPGGTVLVVRNPRARLVRRAAPSSGSAGEPDPTGPQLPRYEETVQVVEVDHAAADATGGPPARVLRPADVRDLAGGFDNVFRSLTTLPGVTAADELGSRLAVRGGTPDQNLTVMDGIEIHNPFRLTMPSEDLAMVGLASAFNSDTVERVEFFPGAFGVRYGDRLSSLTIVKNRDGSHVERLQGAASVGLGDANVTLEGRLPPGADGSWLVSLRRTYFELLAERVTGTSLPTFTDVHARGTWAPRPGRRLSAVILAGRERLRPSSGAGADAGSAGSTHNALVGLTFESSLGSRMFMRTVASASEFDDALEAYERSYDNSRGSNTAASIANGGLLQFRVARQIGVDDLALRQELIVAATNRHQLDAGVELHDLDTTWSWAITGDRSLQQANASSIRLGSALPAQLNSARQATRVGAWLGDRWQVTPRVVFEPGVRIDRSSVTDRLEVSPRLSGAVRLGQGWRLDAAVRRHAQSPGYEKLLQSDYFVDLSPTASHGLRAERALHAVVGVERTFARGLVVRADVYHKRYNTLILGRLESEDERRARLDAHDVPAPLRPFVSTSALITTEPVNAGRGRASGVEVHVLRLAGPGTRVSGAVTYSLGRAWRTAYDVTRPFDYDRRHSLTATARLKIGARLDAAVTIRAASGLPRTPVRGVRLSVVDDVFDADGDGNRAEMVPQLDEQGAPMFQPDYGGVGDINSGRLPRFVRVDARLTYRPARGGDRWAFYADVVNLFNGKNITQVDSQLVLAPGAVRPHIVEVAQDRGIPVFPSIGIRFWF